MSPQLFNIFVGACCTTAKILGGIVSNIFFFVHPYLGKISDFD